MKINIYSIIKPSKDEFDVLIKEFIKMSSKYAKVEVFYIFNKNNNISLYFKKYTSRYTEFRLNYKLLMVN